MSERVKRVEAYIPDALSSLKRRFPNGEIPNKYSGYIASFGASLTQSGLISTLAFYSNQSSKKGKSDSGESNKADRLLIIKILGEMLEIEKVSKSEGITLLEYVLDNPKDVDLLKERIKRAATALKLAIRTFKLTDGGEGDD